MVLPTLAIIQQTRSNSWPGQLKTVKLLQNTVSLSQHLHALAYIYVSTKPHQYSKTYSLASSGLEYVTWTDSPCLLKSLTEPRLSNCSLTSSSDISVGTFFTANLQPVFGVTELLFQRNKCTKELIQVSWCIKVFRFNTFHCVENHRGYKSNKS